MRIIAGQAKGHPLRAPQGMNTRPTSERVREAIFSGLAPYLPGAMVCDVFAGSGALGLESLSRGAKSAVLIEKDKKAQEVIAENIKTTRLLSASLYKGDCLQILSRLSTSFDLIFLDPPYNRGLLEPVLRLILNRRLLADDGLIILETAAKNPEFIPGDDWDILREKRYGDTLVYFCSCKKSPDAEDIFLDNNGDTNI